MADSRRLNVCRRHLVWFIVLCNAFSQGIQILLKVVCFVLLCNCLPVNQICMYSTLKHSLPTGIISIPLQSSPSFLISRVTSIASEQCRTSYRWYPPPSLSHTQSLPLPSNPLLSINQDMFKVVVQDL
jgi:hypothetical protein